MYRQFDRQLARPGLDYVENKRVFCSCWEPKPDFSAHSLVSIPLELCCLRCLQVNCWNPYYIVIYLNCFCMIEPSPETLSEFLLNYILCQKLTTVNKYVRFPRQLLMLESIRAICSCSWIINTHSRRHATWFNCLINISDLAGTRSRKPVRILGIAGVVVLTSSSH
jgi:hypothetical protein